MTMIPSVPMPYTVADIQKLLIDSGFKITPSGKMDQPTTNAIKTFQGAQKLTEGCLGPGTISCLKAFAARWGRY